MPFTALLGAAGGGGGTSVSSNPSQTASNEQKTDSTGSTSGGGYRGSVVNNFSVGGSSLDATTANKEATGSLAGLPIGWILAGVAVLVLGGIYLWKKL